LQPDIITFNEIPLAYTWEMTNFVAAFLPGYHLATNSGTDGYIRSAVASRFPILSSQKWLDGVSLTAFGYSGSFTRDLFQARVAVPGLANPLSVFTTHLKATTSSPQNDANRRAAEAGAISNFFVTTYLTGPDAQTPYLLTGDLNEDVFRPDTNRYSSGLPVQRLVSGPTGLRLTTPRNPYSESDLTLSIRSTLNVRFDYILPCGSLYSNLASSQVFRTDLLPALPAPLLGGDSATSSDHLPVMMSFNLATPPQPFQMLALVRTNNQVTVSWQSTPGGIYRLETSSNLITWTTLASSLVATASQFSLSTNLQNPALFFRAYRQP
jgi:endonuclease/exonuclease/phosphatase family metal-dependent hydrolase